MPVMRMPGSIVPASIMIAVVIAVLCPRATSQIVFDKTKDGKQIVCMESGLFGFGRECGTQDYEEVFVGTILSVSQMAGDETSLSLHPEEVFKGAPSTPLSVTTSQGLCLPDLHAGDRWLFYLRQDKEAKRLTLAYGSPSGLVSAHEEDIDRLRRLIKLNGEGLVKGTLTARDEDGNTSPSRNRRVILRRLEDNAEYVLYTDHDGHFEFPPVRSGRYDLDLNAEPGLWTNWSGVMTVEARECMDYSTYLEIDGIIAGYVRSANGKSLSAIQVEAVSATGFSSSYTDASGHFEIHGLVPGEYSLGLHISAAEIGKASLYAPGVRDRAKAQVIELGRAEKRDDVDIRLPAEDGR